MSETLLKCPSCRGVGELHGYGCGPNVGMKPISLECGLCDGGGEIGPQRMAQYEWGRERRNARVNAGISQREEAARLRISPYDLSKAEQGIFTHPMMADLFVADAPTGGEGAANAKGSER